MNRREMESAARLYDPQRKPDREVEHKSEHLDDSAHARERDQEVMRDQAQRDTDFNIAAWFGLEGDGDHVRCMTECWYG